MSPILLLAVLLLVLVNGFFVAAEYSLVRSRRSKLEAEAEAGQRGARLALAHVDRINDYISACQVGITMASIGIGALGEPIITDLVRPALEGPLAHGAAVVISVLIAYLVITSAHIIVGELVPKVYVIQRAESVIRIVARPLQWARVVFQPFTVVLTAISNRVLRLLGVDPDQAQEAGGNPDELKRLIAESYTGGKLEENEASMLSGVFHLHEQEARQVMTPFPAVVTVDVAEDAETALRRCVSSGHTRLVVTENENPDRVKGFVHSNGLAELMLQQGPETTIESLVLEAPIIPETKPLDDLLADLQRQRTSLAIVVDEYGRTAGVVTVEDIVEEVVGAARCAGWRAAIGSCAATSRSPTSRTTGSSCPSTPTPTTRWAASCSPRWVACRNGATRWAPTATPYGWSPCARTASRQCGSASAAPAWAEAARAPSQSWRSWLRCANPAAASAQAPAVE